MIINMMGKVQRQHKLEEDQNKKNLLALILALFGILFFIALILTLPV